MTPAATEPSRTGTGCKIILITSPKGGSGKSVLSRHLLVSAAQSGIAALGFDFDRQQTLAKWSQRRARTREAFPEFAVAAVEPASLLDWRAALRRIDGAQLAVLDTPPSVEDHLPAIHALAEAADLVLVPSVCTQDDVESVAPWVRALTARNLRPVVVLNRANRRTSSFARMRGALIRAGAVCPTDIPQLEDIHVPSVKGLTLLDYSKSRGIAPFEDLWAFVRREVGL
jgi:chromosome partitioning protein